MGEKISNSDEVHKVRSAEELLLKLSEQTAQLEVEASRALYEDRDTAKHDQLVRQRAELIASMTQRLVDLRAEGVDVPQDLIEWAASLSGMAKNFMETNNTFGMLALLTPRGSQEGDPDMLQAKAAEISQTQAES